MPRLWVILEVLFDYVGSLAEINARGKAVHGNTSPIGYRQLARSVEPLYDTVDIRHCEFRRARCLKSAPKLVAG